MFSGIIEALGFATQESDLSAGKLVISSNLFLDGIKLGDSVAVNGVCLTSSILEASSCCFDISSETLRCTTLGKIKTGTKLNLERSLPADGRIHGHFVLGHVDGTTDVMEVREEANNTLRIRFRLPRAWRKYIISKGSIAIDGVSLTVGMVEEDNFCVYIIPVTRQHTALEELREGDLVNVEFDCLARYVVGALTAMGSDDD